MKKLFALLLTLALVLSFGITAMAAEPVMTSKATTYEALIKTYNVVGGNDATLYPAETLTFTSTPAVGNPDPTNLTVNDLEVTGNTKQKLVINVPAYSKVGVYHYTITENAGNTQGVTYTTDAVNVSVLVEYDYTDEDGDGYGLKATIGVTNAAGEGEGELKHDTFTNTYSLGSLTVSKEVAGNLASQSQEFAIDVTFTSDKPVLSTITCGDGQTITSANWTQAESVYTAKVTVKLIHGQDVTFNNIPAGVTYTVVEQAKHEAPDPNGSNPETGYTVTYEGETGTIAENVTAAAKVINTKGTTVNTGVVLDSLPYVLLIAVAVVAVVLFTVRKRRNREV